MPSSSLASRNTWAAYGSLLEICPQCLSRQYPVVPRVRQFSSLKKTRNIIRRTLTTASRDQRQKEPLEPSSEKSSEKSSLLEILEQRGLIGQIAGDRDILNEQLRSRRLHFYSGLDPTAPSLHLGHLLPFMLLLWAYREGHRVISLVGGATVQVGDPTGRLVSRQTLEDGTRKSNVEAIWEQTHKLWEFAKQYSHRHGKSQSTGSNQILDNHEWLGKLRLLDFLRFLGTGVRLGPMLGRDTVKNKMEKGDGMSFAELTYPLLQAWDWVHMYRSQEVQIQVGGSDQYGNIVAGIDAIKHMAQHNPAEEWQQLTDGRGQIPEHKYPVGITVPLLTSSSGEKVGKSAGNAVWLNSKMTSPFDLYGHLLRTPDADAERFLKMFTMVSLEEITKVMELHAADPGKRVAQHLLASEVVELVHGAKVQAETRAQHSTLRVPTLASILSTTSAKDNAEASSTSKGTDPNASERILLPQACVHGHSLSRILFFAGLAETRNAAQKMVQRGGVYVATLPTSPSAGAEDQQALGFVAIKESARSAMNGYLLRDNLLVLRLGKWKIRIIEVVPNAEYQKLIETGEVKKPTGMPPLEDAAP